MASLAGSARADEPTTAGAGSTSAAAEPETRPPDRPVPDYDGLPEQGDDAGDVGLWTLRVLTSPLYFVSEYVLRRPIGWALTEIERRSIILGFLDLFRFGPNNNIAVFPTFFYELGFQPSVGVYAIWDEFLFPENRLSVQGGFGGTDWLSATITDRIVVGDRQEVGALFLARKRPDYVFGGIGPNATDFERARFGAERIEAALFSAARFWQSSDLELELRYRSISFVDRGWDGELSVGDRAALTGQALPFGFDTGYEAVGAELRVDVDTRTPYAPPEGGARVAAHFGQHTGFGGLPQLESWLSWGGSTTLATDVLGAHRVLGVTADAHLVTPLGDSEVPFTELVDVGGARGLLPGYRPGHIQGLSAVGLIAHYTWPIWAFLDARLFVGTANAFGLHLEDFDVELLRLTFGLAIVPRVPGTELPFEFNFGFATDTFERGASMDSFRFAVGARDML